MRFEAETAAVTPIVDLATQRRPTFNYQGGIVAQNKLQAIGLRHEYYQPRTGGRLLALDNVNLEVNEGEFATIVGPSGCGKTTFINLCDGLLKPTAGQIMIDGKLETGPGTDRGMVLQ